jgi:hypothetical protein
MFRHRRRLYLNQGIRHRTRYNGNFGIRMDIIDLCGRAVPASVWRHKPVTFPEGNRVGWTRLLRKNDINSVKRANIVPLRRHCQNRVFHRMGECFHLRPSSAGARMWTPLKRLATQWHTRTMQKQSVQRRANPEHRGSLRAVSKAE